MKQAFLITVILASLLTVSQSPAAETGTSPDRTQAFSGPSMEQNTAEIRMLNDLAGYLYQREAMYEDVQWALGYFDRFDGQRSWENLQLARASLAIARNDIAKRSMQESEMTMEDQMELMRKGIDVSFMEGLEATFEDDKTTLMNTCLNLHYDIMEGVFLQDDWDICMRYVSLLRDLMAGDIQYLANTADWVLAALNDKELSEKLYSVMDCYCPLIRACQAEILDSPDTIEAETVPLLDHIDELLMEEAKIVGAKRNRLNILTEWVEQEDFSAIGDNLLEITDMPMTLFYPAWYNDEDIYYYWKENGEVVKTPTPGTELTKIPDGCQIGIMGVSKDEVIDYQEELEEEGLSCLGSSETEGKLYILYEYEDSKFTLVWEEENVNILMTENPVCFVPGWYLTAQ